MGDGAGFIATQDVPGATPECSIWDEDCPEGEKCVPKTIRGEVWNGTRCVPIAKDPDEIGEPCTVEDDRVSWIDSCALHALCWDADRETRIGHCVAICSLSEGHSVCDDPNTLCMIDGSTVLPLCLSLCDPIVQDCREGQACYGVGDGFICLPDASGSHGAPGDSCAFLVACDPGSGCIAGKHVPGCHHGLACCSRFCDVRKAAPPCLSGQSCVPFFAEGDAPYRYAFVGICGVPQ